MSSEVSGQYIAVTVTHESCFSLSVQSSWWDY